MMLFEYYLWILLLVVIFRVFVLIIKIFDVYLIVSTAIRLWILLLLLV